MYSPTVFALTQLAAEAPYSILCATVFFLLFYFPVGFNFDSSRAGYQFLMIMSVSLLPRRVRVLTWTLQCSRVLRCHSGTSYRVAFALGLYCGYAKPFPTRPVLAALWSDDPRTRSPAVLHLGSSLQNSECRISLTLFVSLQLYQLDPVTRFISGMLATELHRLPIVCNARELVTFIPPTGQTCAAWAGDFVSLAGGYIVDPLSTTACEYCQFAVGNEYLAGLDILFADRWRDFGVLVAFCCSNAIITILATKYLVRPILSFCGLASKLIFGLQNYSKR